MTEFRESITSSISFEELKDWIMSGLVISAMALSRLVRKRGISQYEEKEAGQLWQPKIEKNDHIQQRT
jgi:hypothetical protein